MSFCGLKQALLCGSGSKKSISNNTIISINNQSSNLLKSNQNNADINIDKQKRDNNNKKPIVESIFDEDIIIDGELTLQFSSTLNTTTTQHQQAKVSIRKRRRNHHHNQQRLLLNMSRNAAIIDDESQNLYKLLQQCSLSKSANIPMIVVKTFIPSDDANEMLTPPPVQQQSKFGLRLFANITKHKQFKQIEIHRGMTINALFSRENWLYIKTAQNDSGYVPLDTCKPVIMRQKQQQQSSRNINKTKIIDATNVSLLDISNQQQKLEQNVIQVDDEINENDELYCEEDENLSELEFSQYDNKNINEYIKLKQQQQQASIDNNGEQHDSIRLFKIKHYFKSLQIETNLLSDNSSASTSASSSQQQLFQQQRASIAIDSGYSDTDSNIITSKFISQSYELLSQCSKPAQQRRGIKTNGSICSVSPNNQAQFDTISKAASVNSLCIEQEPVIVQQQQVIEQQEVDQVKQIDFVKHARPNLSTIIEQSYNSTCELQRAQSSSLLANNSLIQINKFDLSNLQSINSTKNSSIDLAHKQQVAHSENTCNYRQIIENYEPLFIEDLAVTKGELVTVLEDENPEWIYVISRHGKGYVPRNCIQFEINL